MKAKEYAQQLIDANYSQDAIFQFSKDLATEISIIMQILYKDSPLTFELDYLKPKTKSQYVMGVDLASGPDFSYTTPGNTLEQRLHEQIENGLLEGVNPDSKPRGLMHGQQIPSTR